MVELMNPTTTSNLLQTVTPSRATSTTDPTNTPATPTVLTQLPPLPSSIPKLSPAKKVAPNNPTKLWLQMEFLAKQREMEDEHSSEELTDNKLKLIADKNL